MSEGSWCCCLRPLAVSGGGVGEDLVQGGKVAVRVTELA